MTHYSVLYKGTKIQKFTAALVDSRDYLGAERFNSITEIMVADLKRTTPTKKHFKYLVISIEMLVGIRGLPARAMVRHAFELARMPNWTHICS